MNLCYKDVEQIGNQGLQCLDLSLFWQRSRTEPSTHIISMGKWEKCQFTSVHVSYVGIPLVKLISIPHPRKKYTAF